MSRSKSSLRAQLAAIFIRLKLKRALLSEREIVAFGRREFGSSIFVPTAPPPGIRVTPGEVAGVPGEWVEPMSGGSRPTLLYVHGGGYFACSPVSHRPITTWLARAIPARVFVPDYRLAPEHRFPAALDDVLAVYRGLLSDGMSPSQLAIAGDSAGGGLALATCVALRDRGELLPAAMALMSPWTDLAMTGDSIKQNRDSDAMFHCDFLVPASRVYIGGGDARHPLASPYYAEMNGLPPMLVQAGSREALYDDSTRVVAKALAAGVHAQLDSWDGVPHGWQLLTATVPEAREALNDVAAFLRDALCGLTRAVA